ncbi:MAG: ComF family protein [bacterium]
MKLDLSLLRRFHPGPLLDLVWPRACEICGRPAGEAARYFCWDCLSTLPIIELPHCSRCGDPVEGAITRDYVCSFCVDREPHFDLARSAIRFKGGVRDVLHRFKYSHATYLNRDLATLLHACVRTHYSRKRFDAVTFVPLHPIKERSRTYNQARLLAGHLAKLMDVPLARGCLRRIRETGTQTHLNLRQRARNVEGAFVAHYPEWIEGRSFLLVDDVMTTGATVSEISRVLKDAGAADVCVVTVARG